MLDIDAHPADGIMFLLFAGAVIFSIYECIKSLIGKIFGIKGGKKK